MAGRVGEETGLKKKSKEGIGIAKVLWVFGPELLPLIKEEPERGLDQWNVKARLISSAYPWVTDCGGSYMVLKVRFKNLGWPTKNR